MSKKVEKNLKSDKIKKALKIFLIAIIGIIILILVFVGLVTSGIIVEDTVEDTSHFIDTSAFMPEKPVIYLYPTEQLNVNVQLDYEGEIIAEYPEYNNGWNIIAYPDGRIINHLDNKEYSYLFWEGQSNTPINWNFSEGFVVAGKDIREFLQKILPQLGLIPKEYNEFIVYWYPQMKNNKYNLIHFADQQYTKTAQITITPEPDSILRVFMVYKALNQKIDIEEQEIKSFQRKGFTVVEWGGTNSE